MTSPNQPAPAGAFVIGGGDLNFGQDYTENLIKSMFKLPEIDLGNALDLMREQLLKLPLEALEVFKPIIPDWIEDDFANVANAVTKIMSILIDPIKFLTEIDWQAFLDQIKGTVGATADQVAAFLKSAAEQAEAAWDNLTQLISDLLTNPAAVIGTITQNMVSGLQTALSNFNTMVNQIGDILKGLVVTPINSAIQNVVDFFTGLTNFQDTTTSNQINQQNFQIAALTQVQRNPLWVSRYPVGDVTYPEVQNFTSNALGTTGPQSAGTAHTHGIDVLKVRPQEWGIIPGDSAGGIVQVSYTGIVDTVAMIAGRDTTSATNVFLEVLRILPDGGATQVSITDVSTKLTTAYLSDYVEVILTSPFIVQAGERFIVRLKNMGSVECTVRALEVVTVGTPDISWGTDGSTMTGKTSYTAAEVAANYGTAAWILPFAALATTQQEKDDQTHTDDYNRSKMGSLWFLRSDTGTNQLGISGNRAAFSGLTDGAQNGLYIRSTGGDKMLVEGTLYETAIAATGPRCGLILNCNRDLSQVVYLGVNLNTAKIYTGSWNSLTERASVGTLLNDCPWQLYYDPATGTYYTRKNGQDIGLQWADTGSIMKHGADFRYGGIRISRSTLFNAGRIDNWTLKDWS